MRLIMVMMLVAGLMAASGCAHSAVKERDAATAGKLKASKAPKVGVIAVSADTQVVGRVILVNADARIVIIGFPPGQAPRVGAKWSLYHQGRKTGEVFLSGPLMDNNLAADITIGTAVRGDEARLE